MCGCVAASRLPDGFLVFFLRRSESLWTILAASADEVCRAQESPAERPRHPSPSGDTGRPRPLRPWRPARRATRVPPRHAARLRDGTASSASRRACSSSSRRRSSSSAFARASSSALRAASSSARRAASAARRSASSAASRPRPRPLLGGLGLFLAMRSASSAACLASISSCEILADLVDVGLDQRGRVVAGRDLQPRSGGRGAPWRSCRTPWPVHVRA